MKLLIPIIFIFLIFILGCTVETEKSEIIKDKEETKSCRNDTHSIQLSG